MLRTIQVIYRRFFVCRDIDIRKLILQESEICDVDTWTISTINKSFQSNNFNPIDFEISKIIEKYINCMEKINIK